MFPFPPNGKARVNLCHSDGHGKSFGSVSIPSEREGTCEPRKRSLSLRLRLVMFPFPPNGKARVNTYVIDSGYIADLEFQFPPNGKARVNQNKSNPGQCGIHVSIPSEREGTCKQMQQVKGSFITAIQFRFPPNGKARVNQNCRKHPKDKFKRVFPFPPNGKARVNL